jgi:hypothetical protein
MSELKGSQFCCITCKYFTLVKSNLQKHLKSKKHSLQVDPEVITTISPKYECDVCNICYKSQSGLWKHVKVCKNVVSPLPADETIRNTLDLHTKIDNLERVIDQLTVLVKNQQPTSITNNNNNNNNYKNIFLNDKCHNAYDIKRFIAGIDFSNKAIVD